MIIKKILPGIVLLLIIPLNILLISNFLSSYEDVVLRQFAKTQYQDDFIGRGFMHSDFAFIIAFGIASAIGNGWTLKKLRRRTVPQLLLHTVIDDALIPLSVFLMVLFNNQFLGLPPTSSLLNGWIVGGLLIGKHVLMLSRFSRRLPLRDQRPK